MLGGYIAFDKEVRIICTDLTFDVMLPNFKLVLTEQKPDKNLFCSLREGKETVFYAFVFFSASFYLPSLKEVCYIALCFNITHVFRIINNC